MSPSGIRVAFAARLVFALCLLSLPGGQAGGEQPRHRPARLESIESAIQSASFSRTPISVVVRGIVTSSRHRIVIEDRTGAIELKTSKPEQISLGDEVEIS